MRKSIDTGTLFAVTFAVLLGGYVRFYPAAIVDFPLNDGGMFYQMTQDLLDHNFSLPVYTSYNGNGIPFGYPPLAFYLMAALQRFFHLEIIDQLHFLPALFSTLCIPAVYFLSRSMTGSKGRSIFAAFAYALMPNSYLWLIMGGGITRALGLLLGILAVLSVWEMFRKPRLPALLWSILTCSLTILSHPEITWFVFLTALLIGLRYGLNKRGILFAGLTIAGILLLTSPWWSVIMHRFGAALFLNAGQTGGFFNLSILLFFFTGESFSTILAVVALFGLFAELARRRYFLAVWLLVIAILSPRDGQLVATIPGAILVGSGIVWVLMPGLASSAMRAHTDIQPLEEIMQVKIFKLVLGILLVFTLIGAMAVPYLGSTRTMALSQDDRQAMEWAFQNTPAGSTFALLTGEDGWHTDRISEWFPALSKRISVATVQGSEWLPDQEFKKRIERHDLLQICAEKDFSCILTWAENNNISFSYLYISKSQVDEDDTRLLVIYSLAISDQYRLIFENPGVSIYRVVGHP
jgi:hypothetical protein